jgi:hypothetical protein
VRPAWHQIRPEKVRALSRDPHQRPPGPKGRLCRLVQDEDGAGFYYQEDVLTGGQQIRLPATQEDRRQGYNSNQDSVLLVILGFIVSMEGMLNALL